jgi:hypothetical protein
VLKPCCPARFQPGWPHFRQSSVPASSPQSPNHAYPVDNQNATGSGRLARLNTTCSGLDSVMGINRIGTDPTLAGENSVLGCIIYPSESKPGRGASSFHTRLPAASETLDGRPSRPTFNVSDAYKTSRGGRLYRQANLMLPLASWFLCCACPKITGT